MEVLFSRPVGILILLGTSAATQFNFIAWLLGAPLNVVGPLGIFSATLMVAYMLAGIRHENKVHNV